MTFHKKNSLSIILAFVILLLIITACGQTAPTNIPATHTAVLVITETPTPATTSTNTPQPTPVPTVSQTISIPPGNAPVIDGKLSPGEWDQAMVTTLSDGSELLLLHDTGYLYLGLRSATQERVAANVYVAENGKITIHHASAALGTAVYQQEETHWQQVRNFEWKCRDSGNSETAQAERAAYFQQEHWVAANSWMGTPNELEYQIAWTDAPRRIAVSMMRSSSPDARFFWPLTLDDDCTQPSPGGLPAQLSFSPDHWAEVVLLKVQKETH